jgi:hypothetical protein
MIKPRRMRWNGANKNVYRNLARKPEGKRPQEDINVDGRTILKRILERLDGIILAQYTDQWRAFVNRVINLRVP